MRNWLGTPAIKSADGLCENPPTPLATKIRRPTSSSKANQYSTPPPHIYTILDHWSTRVHAGEQ